jgi:hypothetical protein
MGLMFILAITCIVGSLRRPLPFGSGQTSLSVAAPICHGRDDRVPTAATRGIFVGGAITTTPATEVCPAYPSYDGRRS